MLLIMWIVVDGRVKTLLDGNKQTITIGVFSDSYWGVQNGYSYQIIDDAIKIFEDEHPGVKVEYVNGIIKMIIQNGLQSSCLMEQHQMYFL